MGSGVQGQIPVYQHRVGHALATPEKRPDSGTKFVQVTGFDHIVIGPAVQGPNAVGYSLPGSQNQNRGLDALMAQLVEYFESGFSRQVQIEYNHVVADRTKYAFRDMAIRHPIRLPTGLREDGTDPIAQQFIVFDN